MVKVKQLRDIIIKAYAHCDGIDAVIAVQGDQWPVGVLEKDLRNDRKESLSA